MDWAEKAADMKVILDTDVILDVLLDRKPHFDSSAQVLDWAERHPGRAAISWHGAANIHYMSRNGAEAFLDEITAFVEIPPCGSAHLKQAISLGFSDLEDAMQVVSGLQFNAQCIVTRNLRDYRKSPIRAMTPIDLLAVLP